MCFSGPFLSISLGSEKIHSNIYLIGYQMRREMKYLRLGNVGKVQLFSQSNHEA